MTARCKKDSGSSSVVFTNNVYLVINVLSVVNHKNSERVDKHTDVVQLLTELDMHFSTLSMVNP